MQQRQDKKPQAMTLRRCTVEHVFGTLKHWIGSTHNEGGAAGGTVSVFTALRRRAKGRWASTTVVPAYGNWMACKARRGPRDAEARHAGAPKAFPHSVGPFRMTIAILVPRIFTLMKSKQTKPSAAFPFRDRATTRRHEASWSTDL